MRRRQGYSKRLRLALLGKVPVSERGPAWMGKDLVLQEARRSRLSPVGVPGTEQADG